MSRFDSGDTAAEPRPLFAGLAPLHRIGRTLAWPLVRIVSGGLLFAHGYVKLFVSGVGGVAGFMARVGIEPALPAAYAVTTLETLGAVCVLLGLFTRFFATGIFIELMVVAIAVSGKNGFGWTNPGGGWEYPFYWGMIFLAIALRGGGPFSLDRAIGREL
jgi:putative oxidoreductase